jgi:hypothetical protein
MELASICRRAHTGLEGTAILSRSRGRDRWFESTFLQQRVLQTFRLAASQHRQHVNHPPADTPEKFDTAYQKEPLFRRGEQTAGFARSNDRMSVAAPPI